MYPPQFEIQIERHLLSRLCACVLAWTATVACFFSVHEASVQIAHDYYGRSLRGGLAAGITISIAGGLFATGSAVVLLAFGLRRRRRLGFIILSVFIALWSALLLPSLDCYPYRFGFTFLLGLLSIGGGLMIFVAILNFIVRRRHKTTMKIKRSMS